MSPRMVLLWNFSNLFKNLSKESNLLCHHLSLQRMKLMLLKKKKVIQCPKKSFKNILFSLRMFPSQENFSSMSLPMARIFNVLNLQPHPPLKPPCLLMCPQLVVKPLLVVKISDSKLDEEDQAKVIDSDYESAL